MCTEDSFAIFVALGVRCEAKPEKPELEFRRGKSRGPRLWVRLQTVRQHRDGTFAQNDFRTRPEARNAASRRPRRQSEMSSNPDREEEERKVDHHSRIGRSGEFWWRHRLCVMGGRTGILVTLPMTSLMIIFLAFSFISRTNKVGLNGGTVKVNLLVSCSCQEVSSNPCCDLQLTVAKNWTDFLCSRLWLVWTSLKCA